MVQWHLPLYPHFRPANRQIRLIWRPTEKNSFSGLQSRLIADRVVFCVNVKGTGDMQPCSGKSIRQAFDSRGSVRLMESVPARTTPLFLSVRLLVLVLLLIGRVSGGAVPGY